MNIHPIRTKADHTKALARISALMAQDISPGTPAADELEVLAQVVENYEKKVYDLGQPEPVDLILFAMEQRGLTRSDMVPFFGSPSRVSEVLSGKRNLTLTMIARLHRALGLPMVPLVIGTFLKTESKHLSSPRPLLPSAKRAKPSSPALAKRSTAKAIST